MYNPVKNHSFGKISQKHCVAGEHQQIVFREVSNAFIVDRLFFSRQMRHRAQFSVDHLGYWNYGNWVPWSLGEVDPIWFFFSAISTAIKGTSHDSIFQFSLFVSPELSSVRDYREDACSRTAYFIRHTAYGIVAYVRHNNHAGSPVLGIPALPHWHESSQLQIKL